MSGILIQATRLLTPHRNLIFGAVATGGGYATYNSRTAFGALLRGIFNVNRESNVSPNTGGRGLLARHIDSEAANGPLPIYWTLTRSVNRELDAIGHELDPRTARGLIDNLEENGRNDTYFMSPSITHGGEFGTFATDIVRNGLSEDNITGTVAHLCSAIILGSLDTSGRVAQGNPFS